MLTNEQKMQVREAVLREYEVLGAWRPVATKAGCNVAVVNDYIVNVDRWHKVSTRMWQTVAANLGVVLNATDWVIVDTVNTLMVTTVLEDAQQEAMFMAISEKAGSGKTASIQHYRANDTQGQVFVLQCEEWHKRPFLLRLCQVLGIAARPGDNIDALTQAIVRFFKDKAAVGRPLLVLDEADKLRPAALRFLIPLYNHLEDELGLVIAGTDYLGRHIKTGVARNLKGYDEIDSRLGRTYTKLLGAEYSDVAAICVANGLPNSATIVGRVWQEAKPRQVTGPTGKLVQVVDDLRRVKRIVKRERLNYQREQSDVARESVPA
jgi:hypothetical protein